jgi:hypothetical protein
VPTEEKGRVVKVEISSDLHSDNRGSRKLHSLMPNGELEVVARDVREGPESNETTPSPPPAAEGLAMNTRVDKTVVAPPSTNALPPTRRRIRIDIRAARRNDLLRARLADALRGSGRYAVRWNVRVPMTAESRRWVRRAKGAYIGASLPCGDGTAECTVIDMVVIDERNGWAGGYAFCWGGSHSSRARRRIAGDLRAAELVLRAYLARSSASKCIATVTVGIIDGAANNSESDDLTVSLDEIADHFDIRFLPANATSPRRSGAK